MAIQIQLDVMLARRKMKSKDLARLIGITDQNLSILKTGKARALRLSTLNAICHHLQCQPGDLLEFLPDETTDSAIKGTDDGS
ncbi:MAG: helix-turn-helix transcriptional regulator [Leptospirales bacterium]|jgi:putative transcriptional regulator